MAHEDFPETNIVEADSEQAAQGVEAGQDAGVEDPAESTAQQIKEYRMNSDGTVETAFDREHREEKNADWTGQIDRPSGQR